VTTLVVCAAVIERDGRFLITRRPQGVHLAGFWEFPGGKCESGEMLADCLARELREELAVEALVGQEILRTTHAYPDRSVDLHFLQCEIVGEASPQVGQDMQWAARHELARLAFPPADEELIQMLTREKAL
jgi:8-oxo-dGTP diphosphatase